MYICYVILNGRGICPALDKYHQRCPVDSQRFFREILTYLSAAYLMSGKTKRNSKWQPGSEMNFHFVVYGTGSPRLRHGNRPRCYYYVTKFVDHKDSASHVCGAPASQMSDMAPRVFVSK